MCFYAKNYTNFDFTNCRAHFSKTSIYFPNANCVSFKDPGFHTSSKICLGFFMRDIVFL